MPVPASDKKSSSVFAGQKYARADYTRRQNGGASPLGCYLPTLPGLKI